MKSLVSKIATEPAHIAKLMLLQREEIDLNNASFKKLKERYELHEIVLLDMVENGFIEMQNCTLSWDCLMQFKAITKKYALTYGGHYPPPDGLELDAVDDWYDSFYRQSWPLSEELFDRLKLVQNTQTYYISVNLNEIIKWIRCPIWLTLENFKPNFFLHFDLKIDFNKIEKFISDYIESYRSGLMDDEPHFSYEKQRDRIYDFLKKIIDGGIAPGNIWLVPMEIWGEQDKHLIRPLETMLTMEQEGFISIKEITDHWVEIDPYPWMVRLNFKISITKKGLERIKSEEGLTNMDNQSTKNDTSIEGGVLFKLLKQGQAIVIVDNEAKTDFTVRTPQYNSPADMLTKYGISNKPGQDFFIKDVENYFSIPLKATPNKILGNAGFKGIVRKVFLNLSNIGGIRFNVNITQQDLESLGVSVHAVREALHRLTKKNLM